MNFPWLRCLLCQTVKTGTHFCKNPPRYCFDLFNFKVTFRTVGHKSSKIYGRNSIRIVKQHSDWRRFQTKGKLTRTGARMKRWGISYCKHLDFYNSINSNQMQYNRYVGELDFTSDLRRHISMLRVGLELNL